MEGLPLAGYLGIQDGRANLAVGAEQRDGGEGRGDRRPKIVCVAGHGSPEPDHN